jgi:hypothetical protein
MLLNNKMKKYKIIYLFLKLVASPTHVDKIILYDAFIATTIWAL